MRTIGIDLGLQSALDNWTLAPKDTIVSVKRLMGRSGSGRLVEVECAFRADHPSPQTNLKSLINEIAEHTSTFERPHGQVPDECEPWNS
jgi:molecular chaperone DnaK (HSP70)